MVGGLLARVNFTWADIAYLVNLTGVDIVRLKGGTERKLHHHAQSVHAKLKIVQGGKRQPVVPGSPKTTLKHRRGRPTI
jgi:hypothetical protein